jgi:hypothetical protein
MTDQQLKEKIVRLESQIKRWAVKHQIWDGSKFVSYLEYYEDEPSKTHPFLTVLIMGESLHKTMHAPYSRITDELDKLMDKYIFSYNYDNDSICFRCLDDELIPYFSNYFEWQWLSNLIQPDYTDLHNELFRYLQKNPDKFNSLTPRKFEILIGEIFKNQGYQTQLGSGQRDGGVDITLFQKTGIDTEVTLVQVKRYRKELAIRLESVAALLGTIVDRKADKGIFVTSSRFLPGVEKFGQRNSKMLKLANRYDISSWCGDIERKIQRDQSTTLSMDYILGLLTYDFADSLLGKILVSRVESRILKNHFYMVVKDSKHICLIMRLPNKIVSTMDWGMGYEIPLLDTSIVNFRNGENVFRVIKLKESNDTIFFRGRRQHFTLWDGSPLLFRSFD